MSEKALSRYTTHSQRPNDERSFCTRTVKMIFFFLFFFIFFIFLLVVDLSKPQKGLVSFFSWRGKRAEREK